MQVQRIPGARALKAYRCPGCDGVIPAGRPHVAVWAAADGSDRRHWHSGCWDARERRPPRR